MADIATLAASAANKEWSLPQTLNELLRFETLYQRIEPEPALQGTVAALVADCVAGINNAEQDSLKYLHESLAAIYRLHFVRGETAKDAQFDPFIVRVQRDLERAWLAYEDARVPDLGDVPSDIGEFVGWFRDLVLQQHSVSDHELFHFLERGASRGAIELFLKNESTLDARFDDLIALAQVGISDEPKLELARNYWDEMGNGNIEDMHTRLFDGLLEDLGIDGSAMDSVEWTALATGNLLSYVTIHRGRLPEALGTLGAVEMLARRRFMKLTAGFDRVGLLGDAQTYHRLHIEVDSDHTEGWLEHVIAPMVEHEPEARLGIARGAYYRLNTSLDHCNAMLAQLESVT
jgi:hypothetical protein